MGVVTARLAAAGLEVPAPAAPVGAYVPAVRTGSLIFTSGQLPIVAGALSHTGRLGDTVSLEEGFACARQCVLNALAAASTVCELDDVVRVIKVVGFVASTPDFTAQPAVINGASETLVLAFGEQGAHAREAVGVAALPLGAPVEVSLVLELR